MRSIAKIFGPMAALVLVFAATPGCSDDSGSTGPECGDGVCEEGETADSCAVDCGCGNGVIDDGEECDATDLGGATCSFLGRAGGTLSCNADCTYNDAQCCDNGCVTDGATQCSGTVIQTCAQQAGGCLDWQNGTDCAANSQVCDDSAGPAVCEDACQNECANAGDTQCNGTVIQTCELQADGCNDLVDGTDCADNTQTCNDGSGTAVCCNDACTTVDETQCNGDTIEICAVGSNGCNEWQLDTQCGANQVCGLDQGVPTCQAFVNGQGEDCSDLYWLSAGQNNITWDATNQDYLTATPGCVAVGVTEGPDVVLAYTATVNGYLDVLMNKPTDTRFVILISDGACGTLTPEIACISDWAPDTMGDTIQVTQGTTYYFYVSDTSSGANPLDNPMDITLTEIDCNTQAAGVLTQAPTHGATDVSLATTLTVDFDSAVATNVGTVTVTGSVSTNLSYDLSTSPSEVSFSNGDRTMTIDPGALFPLGETVTVSWTGMQDALCGNNVPAPTWSFQVQTQVDPGEDCSNPLVLNTGTNQYSWFAGLADYITSNPCGTTGSPDGPDVVGSFTAPSTGLATITMQKPASNRMMMAVYEGTCGDLSNQLGCQNEYTPTSLTMDFWVTQGQTYYVYFIDNSSGTATLPNPLDITIDVIQPPCTPGTGGMVGTTDATFNTGLASFSDYFVAADADPAGYVYVGGTTALYRMPKAGGAVEDVEAAAGLVSSQMGYDMLIVGDNIFTVESSTSISSGILWRISTDGGTTWDPTDFATFPAQPADDIRALYHHNGRIYMVTHEGTSTVDTEIYSVDANPGAVPTAVAVEGVLAGETSCSGLAVDDNNIYLACSGGERLVRLDRAAAPNFTATLVTDQFDLSGTKNTIHAVDTNSDGTADILYFQSWYEEIYYVCDPSTVSPFISTLAGFGTASGNYGLGFDPVANALWIFDDDVRWFYRYQ